MGNTLAIVLAGILITILLLYLVWQIIEILHIRRVRRRNERRSKVGDGRFCRWYVDESGNWGRVITKTPRNRTAE